MKPLLATLLLVSLAGNAVLAIFALRQTAVSPPIAPGAATLVPARASAPPVAPLPVATDPATWQTLKPGANLHNLIGNLRQAGFPPSVIRAIANQMVSERLDSSGVEHLPFWKQNPNNPEYLAAQQKLSAQRRDLLVELLGPDARPSAALEPATRERRYGSLSNEKIDQVDAITREFSEMRTKLYADRKSGDTQGMMSTQAGMEEAMHKELATILTPAELEQYEMRSSSTAGRLMGFVKSVDVTEAEYTALFRAQKDFDAVDPLRLSGSAMGNSMIQRFLAQDQLNEQARAVLPDDRFYEYLKGADSSYARTAQFTANYPAITPAMTYELTRLERDYLSNMMTMSQAGAGTPPADRVAQMTAARKEYQDKLNALLGSETATAYANRNRPGSITAGPAVRVGP